MARKKVTKEKPSYISRIMKRRDCNSVNLCKPQQATSLRAILDRVSQGLPINAKIAKHTPLPPDGDNPDDFDTGTEEYIDLVDVQHLNERIQKQKADAEKAQAEAREKAKKEAFNKAVQEELAKLQQNASAESNSAV